MFCKSAFVVVVAMASLVIAGRGGHHGGSRGQQQQNIPPFLQNATTEARQEFQTIFKNETLTLAEQKAQVTAWAAKYEKQAEVTEFEDKRKQKMNEFKQNATTLVNSLPAKFVELYRIFENENQTRQQQAEALKTFHTENAQAAEVLDYIIKPSGAQGGRQGSHQHRQRDGRPSGVKHLTDNLKALGGARQRSSGF